MKNKKKTEKVDKVLDTVNAASSLITLTEISKVPLEYSSIRHPELLESYEKASIHAIRKKMLGEGRGKYK